MKMRNRILALALAVLLVFGMLPELARAADLPDVMTAFYVSPDGSDQNDGLSPQKPFATLAHARDEVRKRNTNMTGDIVVYLMDGVWELSETLRFDERDSGTNGFFVRYEAAPGAKPVVSGGRRISAAWTEATEVSWLRGGLKAWKTPLARDSKLRAIYVNDQRASLTRKTLTPKRTVGTYSITAGQADWAWVSGSKPAGSVVNSSDLPANTRNPQNIELESGSTWVKAMVCAAALKDIGNGETQIDFQMPYAAIAQSLLWNCAYNPTGRNDVTNVFEWLSNAGEFYFDQAGGMLYYIPRPGEDMRTAEVVVPELEQLVDVRGSDPMKRYAENIIFDGIKFAYTDWNLVEVGGSYGNCTQQGATILTKYAGNWHNDIYRAYDIPAAAIQVNTAKNVRFLNGEVSNTGYLGMHLENDVWECDVTGNFIARTGGAGVVVGHLQHVYENDTPDIRVGNGAPNTKEKFPAGTESVPKHIRITNNYLLENCYFFPGNSPITSFYTYDMQVLNNFIYKCSYSGMSIGWGWCEFDGTSSSQLPGKPTVTSRKNTVSNNRVEEICSILQDAGGIYTLGQQGNEDWTDVTVMNNNYINASRTPQQADGSRMVNGFHPDEGSAYILLDGNVVTNIIRNVYELNNWQRKHDVIVTNGFSNTDRSETTAPNCSLEQYVNAECIWPLLGYKTVLDSGLENDYVHMVGKDVIADTEYELASNVQLDTGMRLPRRGLLKAEDTVWIAPEGTKTFAEGPTVTKAAGNESSVMMPETPGVYKLYIVYADGSVSAASKNTIYLGEAKLLANVDNGKRYSVSALQPLLLELDDDNYRFTLNGRTVKSGEKLSEAGTWTLHIESVVGDTSPSDIVFETFVSESNRLLPKNVTVASGGILTLADNLNDPTLHLWLASRSASAFAPGPDMSGAAGDRGAMTVPLAEGVYDLTVVNADGEILSRSDAAVKVVRGAQYVRADRVEPGKQYVIVSGGYALSAQVAQPLDPDGETALAAVPVTVEEDRITTGVSRDMIWTFTEDGPDAYHVLNNGRYLSRAPSGSGTAPLDTWSCDSENEDPALCSWRVFDVNEDGDKGLYLEGDDTVIYALRGEADGFRAPIGPSEFLEQMLEVNRLRLYEVVPEKGLDDVDFTDSACLDRVEIVNPSASRVSDRGLYMVTTKDAFEPANDQLSGSAATTPKDLVLVPVEGDWTATLRVSFDPTANNGYYQFFGFYAMQDDQNCAGIRGGDGAMQDFLRLGGAITAETKSVGPGFSEQGTYWFRIVKEGTSYTCARSADGEEFTKLFDFADTGIDAKNLAIDAYTGMTEGYTFYLEQLSLESAGKPTGQGCAHEYEARVSAPTCTEAGFTAYSCKTCDDSYLADVLPALGHEFRDGKCIRCGLADPGDRPEDPFRFNDVRNENAFYFKPVYWAYEARPQITNGMDQNYFGADVSCSRGQVVTFLWRAAGCPEPESTETKFNDVGPKAFYTKAVAWAVEEGITNGMTATTFAPGATCTRGQIVTFLWRFMDSPAPKSGETGFTDVEATAFYARAVAWAVENKVTNGMTAVTFAPNETCTRGQVVTFLYRAMGEA